MIHGIDACNAWDSLRLEGAPNFRDLGGLTTTDGRRLRPRLLFRSEGPGYFNQNDQATLRSLGVRTVCDLRSDGERTTHPNHWCGEAPLLNVDIPIDARVLGNQAWELMQADPTAAGARAAMAYNYRAIGRTIADPFRRLIDHLLTQRKVPLLVHCTAGKDRTGVVVALLLHALEVPADQIEADYMLSSRFAGGTGLRAAVRKMFGDLGIVDPPPELAALIVGVEAAYLEVAMNEMLRGIETLDRFFEERVGLDRSRRAALQEIFLEIPAP
jgi:protein-tyrosine phosphatase